jgi:hypothetical protein
MTLTSQGILARVGFAFLLVLSTYNPSGFSYFHWVVNSTDLFTPYIAISGFLLLIGWGIYANATFNSLGMIGIVLLSALFASLVWLFIYWGWLSLNNFSAMAWVLDLLLGILLGVGICWSHISRRLSGQVDVDDIET